MYMRGAKVTYANELMKNAMMEFMSRELDLTNGMRITFRVHLSENQLIHIMVFPDEDAAEGWSRAVGSYVAQIKSMGVKIEPLQGDISHFAIASDVPLDELRSS